MILPLPIPCAVQTQLSACLLGGTASQATALAKAPTFAGWTVVSESWAPASALPTGVPAPDPATVADVWTSNPTLSFRASDLQAESIGTLAPADVPFPALTLAGGDPSLGIQLRFRVRRRAVVCPSAEDAAALVAAAYGTRRSAAVMVAQWGAAVQTLTPWGASTVSASWPKP